MAIFWHFRVVKKKPHPLPVKSEGGTRCHLVPLFGKVEQDAILFHSSIF
jgi:hypothetical protein